MEQWGWIAATTLVVALSVVGLRVWAVLRVCRTRRTLRFVPVDDFELSPDGGHAWASAVWQTRRGFRGVGTRPAQSVRFLLEGRGELTATFSVNGQPHVLAILQSAVPAGCELVDPEGGR